MITVINNFNESTEMYEGMSLADASAQFMLEANQLVNDFMMDLLMTEHQYLFDHGEQLDWTQEAADGGLGFMDKIGNLVDNAKNLFLKIVNSIIAFVQEKTTQVINWFRKIGLDKAKIEKAFKKNPDEDLEVPKCITDYNGFISDIESGYEKAFANASNAVDKNAGDSLITSAGEFLEEFDPYFEDEKVKASGVAVDNVIQIIFKSDKILKSAKKAYKKATDSLESAKKKIASKKTRDADDIKDELEALRAGVLNNTYVMRDLVKLYGTLTKEAINIAKDLVKVQKDKDKDKSDEEKKNDKISKRNEKLIKQGKLIRKENEPYEPSDEAKSRINDELIKQGALKKVKEALEILVSDDYDSLLETYEYIFESTIDDEYNDILNEAADYLIGCINEEYEIDEELLEACADYIIEAKSDLEKDIIERTKAAAKQEKDAAKQEKDKAKAEAKKQSISDKAARINAKADEKLKGAATKHDAQVKMLDDLKAALIDKYKAAEDQKTKDKIRKQIEDLERKYDRAHNAYNRANNAFGKSQDRVNNLRAKFNALGGN